MCMFKSPKAPPLPAAPVKMAAMKAPDGGAVKSAAERRVRDRRRAAMTTILTSGSGLEPADSAQTAGKTLLGQ